MSRILVTLALAAALAPIAGAQQPGPRAGGPGGPGGPMGPGRRDAASMLLGQTAELKLSDAQVTRLAAIARRSGERRTANRNALDSLRQQFQPNGRGSAQQPPAGPPAAARALMERLRTQNHDDLRDALAVLTPDQQATAWEQRSRAGMGGRMRQPGGRRQMMGGGGRMGPGGFGPGRMGPQGGRGMRQPAPGDSVAPRPRRPEN